MKGLFNYDNKIMQALGFVADLMILNVLFLVCSLPIVTIGASQAGISTGIKVLLDKEDDRSVVGAFFRGFTSGFLKITGVWLFLTLMVCGMLYAFIASYILANGTFSFTVIVSLIALAICIIFQTMVPIFHSRFNCKPIHLISNVFFLLVAHPLRTLGSVLLIWIPVIILGFDLYTFLAMGPVYFTLMYGIAYLFAVTFMRKPFKTLTDEFNRRNGMLSEDENVVDEEPEEEEMLCLETAETEEKETV